ncbi:hypothetical protein LPW11_00215 [Geomonas sp. RF6]|uniref:hypothetical protein n=1 Tax=Geomonas sp. RF6 TaxID=2897342 RepID=UPI001E44CF8A|nr:hypothetical protein [Geomonas sp. RF6]UFS70632.1 hypothetical protein LPW11_00215 [Geomonas sp. RF6]
MMRRQATLLLLLFCLAAHPARGEEPRDENEDLELIPQAVRNAPQEAPSTEERAAPGGRAFLENALTGWVKRKGLAVPVPDRVGSWQNRTSADMDYSWQIAPQLRLGLSDRLSLFEGNVIDFPSAGTLRNDFREGVISWEFAPRSYLEAGRINLKSGTALGYNPTDYFKARTTVNLASIDPSALRENRLGTVMVLAQKIWDNGSATVAFAPKLQNSSPLARTPASLDPLLGQTNSENRLFASASYSIAELSPQLLLFHDDIGTHIGVNVSRVLSSGIVGYLEWSGVREESLTERAIGFGQETRALPPGIPVVPQGARGKGFKNDVAVGASWTGISKLTVNLEYHYHQAGLNGREFDRWITLGKRSSALSSELWYLRQYAADQQEPFMQHQIFLRFDYPDAIPSRLNTSGVLFISPYDGSSLTQLAAQYFISREWTVGAYVGGTFGGRNTVMGSLPWRVSGVLQVVRYL